MNPAPIPDQSHWLVTLASAVAAGLLALIPVYQRWREVRREQDAANHASGVHPAVRRRAAVVATLHSWETWAATALAMLILGGLLAADLRARTFLREWRTIIIPAERRQQEMLDILRRIEVRLPH